MARSWPICAPAARDGTTSHTGAPTFSVIIPAYQAAPFVRDAVSSALAQTTPPLEVIVADDGSTDDIVGALEGVSDKITLVRFPHRGVSATKNDALRQARGDFVTILDADDVFLDGRLEALTFLARARPDLDVLTTDANITSAGEFVRRLYSASYPFPLEEQEVEILRRCFLLANSAVRRGVLLEAGAFDVELRRGEEDWDAWIRVFRLGGQAGLVDVPLVEYRQTPGSLTSNRLESLRGRILVLEKANRTAVAGGPEHTAIQAHLRSVRERVLREEAKKAIAEGASARRRSAAVVVGRGVSLASRMRALVGVIAPGLARKRLQRQAETSSLKP